MSHEDKMKHSTEEFATTDLSEEIAILRKVIKLLLTRQRKLEDLLSLIEKLQKDNAEKDVKFQHLTNGLIN